MEPLAYSINEVATALKVSVRTVRNLLRQGQLVRRKIGARSVVPKSSLDRFLTRDHRTGEEGRPKKEKLEQARS